MSRRVLTVAGLLGTAVLVLLLGTALGWWQSAPSGGASPAAPLTVQTALAPNPTSFGDPVEARVTVGYDAGTVAGSSIRIDTSFAPFVETAPPAVSRLRAGRTGTLVYAFRLQCLTDDCLPLGKARTLRFPQAVVTATSVGSTLRATDRWPQLVVASRLTPAEASGNAHFRRAAGVPAPAYAVAPGRLSAGLVAAAVILAVGAVVLLAIELLRLAERRRARAAGVRSRRALALAYAREAAARDDAADRRKALGLLAETLADEGEPALAASAVDVAWSETPPSPDRTLRLVDEVERTRLPEDP
jgi:hypothetical protein